MAYNPYTRLLLKFDGSAGDSSEFAHPVTYGGAYALAPASDPFGGQALQLGVGGVASYVQPVDPTAVFSQLDSYDVSRTIDLWVAPGSDYGYLMVIESGSEFSIQLYMGGATTLVVSCVDLTANWNADGEYFDGEYGEVYADVPTLQTGWHHVRVRLSGQSVTLGVDGVDHGTGSLTISPVFKGGLPVDLLYIGHPYAQPFTALVDSVQFLEGDNSWTGGSYTVPAQPDIFGSALPELFGAGANTLENTTTQWIVEGDPSGTGANTVGGCIGTGGGVVYTAGSGATALDVVVSSTPATHNLTTRLLLNFETFSRNFNYPNDLVYETQNTTQKNGVASAFLGPSWDTASDKGVALAVGQGVFGTNALRFGNPAGAHVRGALSAAQGFDEVGDSAKRISLWFKPEVVPAGLTCLLSFAFYEYNNRYLYVFATSSVVGVAIMRNGVVETVETSFVSGSGTWRNLRIFISGTTIKLAIDGTERASRTFATTAWPLTATNYIQGCLVGEFTDQQLQQYGGFRGLIDGVEFLEGDTSWTGGSYTVPTKQSLDYDALAVDRLSGVCADSTISVESSAEGCLTPISIGSGSSTLDDMLVAHTSGGDVSGYGANVVAEISSICHAVNGPFVAGDGVSETTISGAAQGTVSWRRFGSFSAQAVGVTTAGEGILAIVFSGLGLGEVDSVVGTGIGGVAFQVAAGVSVSTAICSSGGVGKVTSAPSCVGNGTSVVGSVVSAGQGGVSVRGVASSVLGVISSGSGLRGALGAGAGQVTTSGSGLGNVFISGSGSSDTSVFTLPIRNDADVIHVISRSARRVQVMTKEFAMSVTT